MRVEQPEKADSSPGTAGSVVLYLHGLGSNQDGEKAEFFRSQFAASGKTFVSIDFRGHGLSQGSNLELCLSRNIEDAKVACDELTDRGVSQIDLVGSSLGGLTALWLARQNPTLVRRAAVIAPALGIREKIGSLLGESLLERWRTDGNLPYVHELGTTVIGYGFWQDLESYPDRELLDGYATPTLVLQGELDETVDPEAVRRFAGAAPTVTLKTWSDGDHRLTDRLDEVWSEMRRFLEG